jgi:DNA repair protein RadA/Sms
VQDGLVAFGEIGLTGRLRAAAQSERRLEECAKLGVTAAVAPKDTRSRSAIRVAEVETLRDAVRAALAPEPQENPRK